MNPVQLAEISGISVKHPALKRQNFRVIRSKIMSKSKNMTEGKAESGKRKAETSPRSPVVAHDTPPPPAYPKGAGKPIRNQEAKRIADEFMRAQWAQYHPLAVRQIVRNVNNILEREIKRAQVSYQIEQAEDGGDVTRIARIDTNSKP